MRSWNNSPIQTTHRRNTQRCKWLTVGIDPAVITTLQQCQRGAFPVSFHTIHKIHGRRTGVDGETPQVVWPPSSASAPLDESTEILTPHAFPPDSHILGQFMQVVSDPLPLGTFDTVQRVVTFRSDRFRIPHDDLVEVSDGSAHLVAFVVLDKFDTESARADLCRDKVMVRLPRPSLH
jgi:hypothetical protein